MDVEGGEAASQRPFMSVGKLREILAACDDSHQVVVECHRITERGLQMAQFDVKEADSWPTTQKVVLFV